MISFGAHKFSQLLRHGLCSEISARHDPTQLKSISKISHMNVCGCVRAEQNNGQSVYTAHIYGWLTVFVNEMEKLAKDCPVKCHSFSLCMRCKIDIAVACGSTIGIYGIYRLAMGLAITASAWPRRGAISLA